MSRTNPIYKFEEVDQNPCGHSLNERVSAVYTLEGFVHRTYRNHEDYPQGKPHWSYVQRGGKLTDIESAESLEDLKQQLTDSTSKQIEITSIGKVFRVYLGLTQQDGSAVDKEQVFQCLEGFLESFTINQGTGCFHGDRETSLIITLAGVSLEKVRQVANDLRTRFNQNGVGIEHDGTYERTIRKEQS